MALFVMPSEIVSGPACCSRVAFALLLCCSCRSSGCLEEWPGSQGLGLCCSCCSKTDENFFFQHDKICSRIFFSFRLYTLCPKQSNTSNTNHFPGSFRHFLEDRRATQEQHKSNTEQPNFHTTSSVSLTGVTWCLSPKMCRRVS